jgi:hypothetical protein
MAKATRSVQVQNASHEKLGNARLARAIAMVIHNEAIIVESDESRIIKTVGGLEIPYPLVIRLLNFIKVPFYTADETFSRSGVLRRDNYTCAYCGKKSGDNMTWDHILPRSRGGDDSWMNAVCACVKCNNKKGARLPEEAGMPLLFEPRIPTRIYFISSSSKKYQKLTGIK